MSSDLEIDICIVRLFTPGGVSNENVLVLVQEVEVVDGYSGVRGWAEGWCW